jgi:RNA polymerase sigma factor (sigma-70 family)
MRSAAPSTDFVSALQEYQPLIRRVCRIYCPADADDRQDLFQEIVVQLWRAWPRYEPRADVKLSTWLYRIALNVAISDLRRRTRRPAPDRLNEQVPDLPEATAAYGADEFAELYQAITHLSDVDKAFVLLYLEDRSYEEMSAILGITQNNVRVKMHRVQEKLRRLLVQA